MNKSKLLLFLLVWVQTVQASPQNNQVNIYSFRKFELIQPLLKQFESNTGIQVNVVSGKSNHLLKRLKQDGQSSLADVLLTSDLIQLHNHQKLLKPILHINQWSQLPNTLKDEQGYWVSVSLRTRALFTHKNTLDTPAYFSELASPKYRGQFCIRDWQHSYNQTLIANLLTSDNQNDVQWLYKGNALLAKRPQGGDRDQLRALAIGHCQFAIANHYYWKMMKESDNKRDRELAEQLTIHHLKMSTQFTPVSTTTVAMAKYAPNPKAAKAFIEFLLTPEAQTMYAELLHEYPVIGPIEQLPFNPALNAVKGSLEQAKAAQSFGNKAL